MLAYTSMLAYTYNEKKFLDAEPRRFRAADAKPSPAEADLCEKIFFLKKKFWKKSFWKKKFWNMQAYTYMQTYDSWNNIPYYTPA